MAIQTQGIVREMIQKLKKNNMKMLYIKNELINIFFYINWLFNNFLKLIY